MYIWNSVDFFNANIRLSEHLSSFEWNFELS